jgi:hypothetical protein
MAFSSFTQQLVQYDQKTFLHSYEAYIPRADRYSRGNLVQELTTIPASTSAVADFSMQSAVLFGLKHNVEQ